MARFYIDWRLSDTGLHLVHRDGCSHMPEKNLRFYLGTFLRVQDALYIGSKFFTNVDICPCCGTAYKNNQFEI